MRVGIPNAGQLNALETLNIRGERSVTCKGAFDAHPVDRAAARGRAGGVRGVPQAARCARTRRRARRAVRPQSRSDSDADVLRRRRRSRIRTTRRTCARRRTTTSNFAMDVPPFDVDRRRAAARQGRDHLREVGRARVQRRPRRPGRAAQSRTNLVAGGQAISAWAGQACNPYDTERVPRGSSSGSGVAVVGQPRDDRHLRADRRARARDRRRATASRRCWPPRGSCPTAAASATSGSSTAPGIHARTLADAAQVLDAVKDPVDRLLRLARSVHGHAEARSCRRSRTRASSSTTRRSRAAEAARRACASRSCASTW